MNFLPNTFWVIVFTRMYEDEILIHKSYFNLILTNYKKIFVCLFTYNTKYKIFRLYYVKRFKALHPENYNKLFASSFYLRILVRMNILRYIWTKLNRKLLWKQRRTYVLLILIALGMLIAAVVYFKLF